MYLNTLAAFLKQSACGCCILPLTQNVVPHKNPWHTANSITKQMQQLHPKEKRLTEVGGVLTSASAHVPTDACIHTCSDSCTHSYQRCISTHEHTNAHASCKIIMLCRSDCTPILTLPARSSTGDGPVKSTTVEGCGCRAPPSTMKSTP